MFYEPVSSCVNYTHFKVWGRCLVFMRNRDARKLCSWCLQLRDEGHKQLFPPCILQWGKQLFLISQPFVTKKLNAVKNIASQIPACCCSFNALLLSVTRHFDPIDYRLWPGIIEDHLSEHLILEWFMVLLFHLSDYWHYPVRDMLVEL